MGAVTLIPVEEYLSTSFADGDREYIDGEIRERNVGEIDHSDLQSTLLVLFRTRFPAYWAGVEVRVQVSPRRFRVPNVCLITEGRPPGRIITSPPFLVAEVLSPDDRMSEVQDRIDDYLRFGVKYVWVINPASRRGFVYTRDGIAEAKDGVLRTANPAIEVSIGELCGPGFFQR